MLAAGTLAAHRAWLLGATPSGHERARYGADHQGRCVACFYTAVALGVRAQPGATWLFASPMPWSSYLTFTQNFWMAHTGSYGAIWLSPTWSLAIEEQFYLTLPVAIRLVSEDALPYVLGATIAVVPILRFFLYFRCVHGALTDRFLMPCRADALLLGVFAAWLIRKPNAWDRLKRNRSVLIPAWVSLAAGTNFIALDPDCNFLWTATFAYSWLALLFATSLLLVLLDSDGPLGYVFRARWLAALGGISYGVYLYHDIFLGLCHWVIRDAEPLAATPSGRAATVLALLVTLLVAWLSSRYFERPLVQLGHRTKY